MLHRRRIEKKAIENKIEFSEALEFALKFKLAEMEALDEKGNCYVHPSNKLMDRIKQFQEVIQSQTEQ